jgi:choline dehydrogenase-like flavoprotein
VLPALLGKADFKGELSLISEAVVSRVELEDSGKLKTATSVLLSFSPRYRDKCAIADSAHLNPKSERTYRVKAKTIVLSAGTLGSAEVLLRSELANDKIGSGITIHPSMGAIGTFDRKINGLEGLSASVYAPAPDGSYFYEAMSATPNFIAALHPGNGHEILETVRHFNELGGFGVMLVDSVSEDNRVFLNPDTKKVEVAYQLSAEDKGKLKIGLSEAIRILLRQGAKSVFLPSSEMVDAQGRYSPIKTVNDVEPMMQNIQLNDGFNVMSSAHMQGSNKLSKDARSGVVSPHFRVWDTKYNAEIPNVYVCDSSVFPTSVGANPMQAIYSIAKLFVDQLLSP